MSTLQMQRVVARRGTLSRCWIHRQHGYGRQPRLLSSMSMNRNGPTTEPPPSLLQDESSSSSLLPFLHSRKKLPPACVDASELSDMTEHLLTTQVGNLFQFDRQRRTISRDDRHQAWQVADGTVQLVEYLLRGHAARVPGTLWEGWTNNSYQGNHYNKNKKHVNNLNVVPAAQDSCEPLETMVELLNRMQEEGKFYMQVRKEHLSQLAWEEGLKEEQAQDTVTSDWRSFARDGTIVDDDEDDFKTNSSKWEEARKDNDSDNDDNDEKSSLDDTLSDYAFPGPTVAMYDVFLDTLAVTAGQVQPQELKSRKASDLLTAPAAFVTLETILARHRLDGDDELNDNVHTMPTQISFNAVIRTVANLPYDTASEVQRDLALTAAFTTMDAMGHSALERNSSTYTYLLQVLQKYVPPCKSRENMAHGLWKLAKTSGVYNDQVQEAYLQAHEPSNSPEHDAWIEENIRGKDWRYDAPHRWRRRVQKYRMIPKQTTY